MTPNTRLAAESQRRPLLRRVARSLRGVVCQLGEKFAHSPADRTVIATLAVVWGLAMCAYLIGRWIT